MCIHGYIIYWLVQINGLIHWPQHSDTICLKGMAAWARATIHCRFFWMLTFGGLHVRDSRSYRVLQKKTAIRLHVVTSHLIPPRPPDQCCCPMHAGIRTEITFFWRLFQAKWCNNIELVEKEHASFFAMSVTGWLFFEEPGSRSCCFGWSLHFMLHCISFLPLAALKESIRA